MAQDTKIEWCDHTVNFWWGCAKVSPACSHCYAEGQAARFHAGLWGPEGERRVRVEAARREALRYELRAVKEGRRFRVFTNSMSDFFEDRRDLDGARLEALDAIRQTPHLDWLILTKRPEKIRDLLRNAMADAMDAGREDLATWIDAWDFGRPAPANVWLGTTVEDQERADQRIPALLQVPAAVRFLSGEPLLGPVDLGQIPNRLGEGEGQDFIHALKGFAWTVTGEDYVDTCNIAARIDWVICGGESGPHARPMHPDWARGLRDQCAAAGVPFLFKQWGEWVHSPDGVCRPGCDLRLFPDLHATFDKVGKKNAGRLLDGVEHLAFPEVG